MAIISLEPVPFKLRWVRQGKVTWRRDWVGAYGPSRSEIPGLDQHVGFANYDLHHNDLPTIQKDAAGQLFVMAIRPLTEAEMIEVYREVLGYIHDVNGTGAAFKSRVLKPLTDLAAVLDVVAYHGFEPAEDSPGLRYLRTLSPQTELRIEFPDGPQAGL
jgi:hypothetical protein